MASRRLPQFRFDPVAHAYYVGDRPLPSITQVLAATAPPSNGCTFYTEAHAERGTRIHAATASRDLGAGWGDRLLETDLPRVWAYDAFLQAHRPRYTTIEQPAWSRLYLYAGTPDRAGTWPDGRAFVLDLKTGGSLPDHALQTAAQVLLQPGKPEAWLRYTLHLRDDGQFRLLAHTDPMDFPRFLARLQAFRQSAAGANYPA